MAVDKRIIGWKLDAAEREALLRRFPPVYDEVVADHVTLASGVAADAPLPRDTSGVIVGAVDDGAGVQALVVRIGGSTARPGGGTYHITWSLGPGRRAVESNQALGAHGWTPLEPPVEIALRPGELGG